MKSTATLNKMERPSTNTTQSSLVVAENEESIPMLLNKSIAQVAREAIAMRGAFTVAMTSGSIAHFLSLLPDTFREDDPQWDKWHVLLTDEYMVPEEIAESNLKTLKKCLLDHTGITESQIHSVPVDEFLDKPQTVSYVSYNYELTIRKILEKYSGGNLDLAVLDFGPDGHVASLFPGDANLNEQVKWVVPLTESPEPPMNRITMTFPLLNAHTRHVIICGSGRHKGIILKDVMDLGTAKNSTGEGQPQFNGHNVEQGRIYNMTPKLSPYPCSAVLPNIPTEEEPNSLTWIVDKETMNVSGISAY